MSITSAQTADLNWATADIDYEDALGPVNWKGLVQYAIDRKAQRDADVNPTACQLSSEYNMGGRNLVRRLHFRDGTCWVARMQLRKHTPESMERLLCEVHTMAVVRERSAIPVPEVYAYEPNCHNIAAVPFMLMEFIPGDTAMDSFGGYHVHKGETPTEYKPKLHAAMADIQVQMSAIRFPRIGRIVQRPDGTYSVGPLPGIGGPFDSAAQFFIAWADRARFPYKEDMVRERTPQALVDGILASIQAFPARLREFSKSFRGREGPFPLFHTDFYSSNMIIDSRYNVMSVIDWEDAFVAPWEVVEFAKELLMVPPVMDGPLYCNDEEDFRQRMEREEYIRLASDAETRRGLDNSVSTMLADVDIQHLAHAVWLYEDGRIGYYDKVVDQLEASRNRDC